MKKIEEVNEYAMWFIVYTPYKILKNPDYSVIKYFVYQHEVCQRTKRYMWKGYIEFYRKVTYEELETLIGMRCECGVTMGSREQNKAWCTSKLWRKKGTLPIEMIKK